MTRISENQISQSLLTGIHRNKSLLDTYSEQISTGRKVTNPGDSDAGGTIALMQQTLARTEGYSNRITNSESELTFQDDILSQVNEILTRAKEVAAQAANETNSAQNRAQASEEIFQIRDHLVQLANSTYQGKYIYGGADDDDPPYDNTAQASPAVGYTVPTTGDGHDNWVFDNENGTAATRTVQIADGLSINTRTPANQLFDRAIQGLERLGRALAGYETLPAQTSPTGALVAPNPALGAAYTFPTDFNKQTAAIKGAMDQISYARESEILPERVDLGGRLRRLETAKSLQTLHKDSLTTALNGLQSADVAETATLLSQAQTALQASYTVTTKVLNQSILDYL